jgi:cysteine desulfurase/selenocysteine lyase
LDNAATSQLPRQVIDTIVRVYSLHYANVHRGVHTLSERTTELFERSRARVRDFLKASSADEIIFTRGATESINLVARTWGDAQLRPGDEIVVTEMEHHANLVPWQQLCQRTGAVISAIPIDDDGLLNLSAFRRLLSARTRLVAVSSISNVLGTINPLQDIISMAHAAGAVVLVDAAQSVPHMPTDVRALDCDFLAFSGHKMLGPTGIGVLYGKRELLAAMPPFLGGGGMIRRVSIDRFEAAELPNKFEAGTPPIVEAIALCAAIDYLESIGLEAIHRHCQHLARHARERLLALGGVRVFGPAGQHQAGIVSFDVEGVHAHDVAQVLDSHGVAVRAGHHCAMPLNKRLGILASTRASFYLYNTADEIDALIEAVRAVRKLFSRV